MDRNEIIEQIAELLEIEESEVDEKARLDSFETWDSVAVLGAISMISDATGRYPHADEIVALETIGDLIREITEERSDA